MPAAYIRGELPGHPVGSTYSDRRHAAREKIHQLPMQGIAGNREVGAVSVVVNGGYLDDDDHGDWLIYTGAGGNDPHTKTQVADQELTHLGNAALVLSEENGYPVRVLRGSLGEPSVSPASGFRYDGLFRVTEHWPDVGIEGFRIWRFRLEKLTADEAEPYVPGVDPTSPTAPVGVPNPGRKSGVVVRTIRNTAISSWVKELYEHTCQICDLRLDLSVGAYAEGAHIRALGKPHNGPDSVENMLCLCPNHHVLFDLGGIYIDDDLIVHTHDGALLAELTVKSSHPIDINHIKHHRQRFGFA